MNRIRILTLFLVLALVTGSLSGQAYAAEAKKELLSDVTVTLNGKKFDLQKGALSGVDQYMISLEDIAKLFSSTYTFDNRGYKAEIKRSKDKLKLTAGSKYMSVNGKSTEMSQSPLMFKDSLYVPVKDIGSTFGYNIKVDTGQKTIDVSKDKSNYILAQDTIIPIQSNTDAKELTLTQAIDKATKKNSNLKALDANLKTYQRNLDDLQQNFSTAALMNPNASAEAATLAQKTALNSLVNMEQTKKSMELANANLEVTKESVEYSMIKLFAGLKDAERAIALQEYNLQNIEANLKISRKKAELGMLSAKDLNTQELSYQSAVKTLNDNKLKLEKSYINLNNVLGEKAGTKYNIELDLVYRPIGEINIEGRISTAIATSTNILKLQQALDMAVYKSGIYIPDGDSYETKMDAVEKAERDLSDAKNTIDNTMRTSYNDLLASELGIEDSERSLLKAREDFKLLQEQYKLGMATELTLKEAAYKIAASEFSLISAKISHELSVMSFNNTNLS